MSRPCTCGPGGASSRDDWSADCEEHGVRQRDFRRPRGRPPLADKRKPRGGFNDAEWAEVKAKAKAEGVTASAWVRERCGL